MKYLLAILSLTIFLAIIITSPQLVSAHFLATDKSVSGLLHIFPNDSNTAADTKAKIIIYFSSSQDFNLNDCLCHIQINENGRQLLSTNLPGSLGVNAPTAVPFVFPKQDLYQVIVVGRPKTPGQFSIFKLSWLVPISGYKEKTVVHSNKTIVEIFLGILLIFTAIGLLLVALF